MLLDFGLVKDESEAALTASGERLGTLRYMSPEQVLRRPADRRADVWALGATLYEVLTLAPAFDGASEFEIERAILAAEPRPPLKLEPRTSRDLATIALTALEKDPEKRYQTAAALADDLDRFLNHEPILARPPGPLRRLARAARRRKAASAAALAAVLAAAVLGSALAVGRERRFESSLEAARSALAAGDLSRGRAELAYLRQAFPARPEVAALAAETSRVLRADGLRERHRHEELRDEVRSLEEAWREAEVRHETWEPAWERGDELAAWERLQRARDGIDERFNAAVSLLAQAAEAAPAGSAELEAARMALGEAYWSRYERGLAEGGAGLDPGVFRSLLESLELPAFARKLEGSGQAAFESEPPGAEVFCFRYETFEARLLPLPFDPRAGRSDPAKGLLAEPHLVVERIWRQGLSPFQPDDRLVAARGEKLRIPGDLARALAPVRGDEAVAV
jgi:hypothetical protein